MKDFVFLYENYLINQNIEENNYNDNLETILVIINKVGK
jgi:hypothetical protein